MANDLSIKFWGVRGSIASPLSPKDVQVKIMQALSNYQAAVRRDPRVLNEGTGKWLCMNLPFDQYSTFGGNTTCAEVKAGDERIIIDMGTGAAAMGAALMPEAIQRQGLTATVLQSHLHWDHIQGWPFLPQLYLPRAAFPNNRLTCYGGLAWERGIENVLQGQMDGPVFPVKLEELQRTAMNLNFESVRDYKAFKISEHVAVRCRKLNHPQETYGYRITLERGGIVPPLTLAFCTDHEGYAVVDPRLVELAKNADLFVTECQYTLDEYRGKGGPAKLGWGHSWPEYIAEVASAAQPKKIVTMHHDPGSSDERIVEIAKQIEKLSGIPTIPAYEGLLLSCAG